MDNAHIIWNREAGSAGAALELLTHLKQLDGTTIAYTDTLEEATELARCAAQNASLVVAAGGDGTVNAVINGLVQSGSSAALGLLPVGTGNNLCRSLRIPLDLLEAAELLESPTIRAVDLVEARSGNGTSSLFSNGGSGGNSDRVMERLDPETKQRWGAWSFLRGAVPVITELEGYTARIQFDDAPAEEFRVWNVILANGSMAAGGLPVAPLASLEDGQLDVVLILDGDPLDVATLGVKFFLGDYLEDERVVFRRASRVRIESDPEMRFLLDGESITGQPYFFSVLPKALRVVVGPEYRA